MEFKINTVDPCKQEVEFEIPYADLTPHFENAFKKYQKKASVPGFRKGKVPISMLKRLYGDAIEQGSLEDVANDVFREYLKDNHVHPLGEGSLIDMDYEPKIQLKFKVRYEVKPEFDLSDYKGMEVTKTVYPIDEKLINEEIKYLQAKNSTYEESDKAESDEYVLTLDIQRLDESGVPVIGQSDKGVKFYLNDNQLTEEMKTQLKGFAKEEERVLNIAHDNHAHKYKAKCTKVEKVINPELNEEFFKKIYHNDEVKDEKGLRDKVKQDLENIYKNVSDQEIRNNIVNELIKINDIPVPDSLVEGILDSYIEEEKNRSPKRELPKDFDMKEYRKTRRVDAILQVKWFLIRDKIIEAEKIEVSDADLEPIIEADSKKYNIPTDKIRKIYENNTDVKYRILDDKLMDFLIANTKIKEVQKTEESIIEN
jgi:trigger factor